MGRKSLGYKYSYMFSEFKYIDEFNEQARFENGHECDTNKTYLTNVIYIYIYII